MIKKIITALAVLALLGVGAGYYFYQQIFDPNMVEDRLPYTLLIPPGTSFDSLCVQLKRDQVLGNNSSFQYLAKWMHYNRKIIPSGRYLVENNMSNYELISKLRIANQDPVRLTFNNVRTYQELSGKISRDLWVDSTTLLNTIDSVIIDTSNGINQDNILCHFIPNTYLIYWDISARDLLRRLFRERDKYWALPERQKALARIHLTPEEACSLASIVEKESNIQEERPTIAGVYLNRLEKGIKLQADPTVVFASGNFRLQRVLNKHLRIQSPYNTYLHEGLPPGPICLPSQNALESVLQAKDHDYLFFCAKPGYQGAHNFAKDLHGHSRNARIYRKWLNSENIK